MGPTPSFLDDSYAFFYQILHFASCIAYPSLFFAQSTGKSSALLVVDAWEETLSGNDLASKEKRFEEMKNAFFLTRLRLSNIPVLEGATSLMKRAGELILFVEKETRDRRHPQSHTFIDFKQPGRRITEKIQNVRFGFFLFCLHN